jgi:hypothetical protein
MFALQPVPCGKSDAQRLFVPWMDVTNWNWQIEGRYPTQAKRRLEWGTQHLLPVRQGFSFA